MSRLIDADAFEVLCFTEDGTFSDGVQWLAERIDEAPTVDAVIVVRCKDCKWFKEFTNNGVTMGYGCCDNPNIRMAKCPQIDWFCADGKRKEQRDEAD